MPTTASPAEIRRDFDAIAPLMPRSDHLGPHEGWILQNLPSRRGTVLEIGCGTGQLARRLARAFDRVVAIDLSEGMIAEARRRTGMHVPIEYACADLFEWLRTHGGGYDCIVSVGTLHHVDLRAALREAARSLAPGGRLLMMDLLSRGGWRHAFINVVAFAAARVREVLVHGMTPWALRRAFWQHGEKETYLTLPEVERIAREELPGTIIRAHLLWRYSVLWDKPLHARFQRIADPKDQVADRKESIVDRKEQVADRKESIADRKD